jgi:LacI family transcriptional regulator
MRKVEANKKVTLKDLAAIVGVTPRTVSLAINGEGRMSKETRQKILKLSKELNYRPDIMGRGLVKGKTFLAGALIPYLGMSFYADVIKGILEECSNNSYDALIRISENNLDKETEAIERFLERRVDGIICYPNSLAGGLYDRVIKSGTPLIQVGDTIPGLNAPSVTTDNVYGGFLATETLIKCNCRNIGFIGWNDLSVVSDRKSGYHKALAQYGLQTDLQKSEIIDYDLTRGEEAGTDLLKRFKDVDGIVCVSDEMAVGVIRACLKAGKKVPQDICIIGYDDLKIADFQVDFPLSTIAQPKLELGSKAAELLIRSIKGEKNESVILKPHYIGRSTTR